MSLESDRERIVEVLSAHYAEDHMTTQELEERFERAYRATTIAELNAVTAGLPALAGPARSPVPRSVSAPVVRNNNPPTERRHVAIMSSLRKGGDWTPSRSTTIKAVMADVKIDLRNATFVDSEIVFDIFAVMAEATIIVPPGVRVECDGFAFMGEFTDRHDARSGDPDAPLVRITGTSFMAKVAVETRLPGESQAQAKRRLRIEGKSRDD